jgi:hypothetical protein
MKMTSLRNAGSRIPSWQTHDRQATDNETSLSAVVRAHERSSSANIIKKFSLHVLSSAPSL